MSALSHQVEQQARISLSSQNIVTQATYDGADNLSVVTLPNGNEIVRTYDAANRLETVTDSVGAVLDLGYDDNGNVTSRANGESNTWTFEYDQANRAIQHDN